MMKTLRILLLATAVAMMGGLASAGPAFFDDFESGTLDGVWTGQGGLDANRQGVVVSDPLDPTNQVLSFNGVNLGGDTFSIATVTSPTGAYVFSFDYLGCSAPPTEPVPGASCEGGSDLGGFAGVSPDFPGTPHYWFGGTNPAYLNGAPNVELIDDGQWHHYTIVFSGADTELHVMLEDFSFSGTTAGDAYFDNVRLEAVPEPGSLVLIASGLAGLALRRRRSS